MTSPDLSVRYLGLDLASPLVVGAAAPLPEDVAQLRVLQEAGAAAVVLQSLFEEQIERDQLDPNCQQRLGRDQLGPHSRERVERDQLGPHCRERVERDQPGPHRYYRVERDWLGHHHDPPRICVPAFGHTRYHRVPLPNSRTRGEDANPITG